MTRQEEILKIARSIAGRYSVRGYDDDELVNEAYLAMAQAPPEAARLCLWYRAWKRLSLIAKAARRRRTVALPAELAARPEEPPCGLAGELRQLLPRREALVIHALFWHGLTPAEVAPRLGVTYSRVNQIKAAALRRLRERFPSWAGADS